MYFIAVLTSGEQNTLTRLGPDVDSNHANMIRAFARARPTRSLPKQLFKAFGNYPPSFYYLSISKQNLYFGEFNDQAQIVNLKSLTNTCIQFFSVHCLDGALLSLCREFDRAKQTSTGSSGAPLRQSPSSADVAVSTGSRATMLTNSGNSSNMSVDLPKKIAIPKSSYGTKKTMRNASAHSSYMNIELSANQNIPPNIISSTLRPNQSPKLRASIFDSGGFSTISSPEDFSSIAKNIKSLPSTAPLVQRIPKPHSTM